MISYDRECASNSAQSDWYGPSPRLNNHHFERKFHIQRNIVDILITNLANFDYFWTQTIDCCRRLSIDSTSKFLAAMKMKYYRISFSTFFN